MFYLFVPTDEGSIALVDSLTFESLTSMAFVHKILVAVLYIAVVATLAVTFAQKTSDAEGCAMTPSQCTCAQSPSTGACTRPTDGGKCLQGDCAPPHKCDCFGYELCSIDTCGKWLPTVNAIMSRTAEFQCRHEKGGAKCRKATGVSDTLDSADSAKAAFTKHVDDIAVDEAELAADLKESITFKIQTLRAGRRHQPCR